MMKQDLVEEVARIYGYANVTPVMPDASIVIPPRDHRINTLRSGLKEAKFTELLHLSFSNPGAMKKCNLSPLDAVSIENPIGEELSLMRTSLLPSMIETIGRELKTLDGTHLKSYEYGRVFRKGKPEALELCAIVATKGKTTIADDPSLILKSDIASVCHAAGYELRFKKTTGDIAPFAHGGRSATISVGEKTVGFLTELHPSIRATFGLLGRASVVVLHLDALRSITPTTLIVSPLPAFPAVEFDETMILGTTPHADIVTKAKAIDPLLQSIRVLHFYEADGIKNVTLRFTYRANDKTLVQSDVEKVHGKVMEEIKKM
jgi:phenylalanyl-tRNA synthetase beta chain